MQSDYTRKQPILGIIPRSRFGRFIFGWTALNVVLTVLPLFTRIGNGSQIVASLLPLTILYSYAVFCSNCLLGAVFYLYRARRWAQDHDSGSVRISD